MRSANAYRRQNPAVTSQAEKMFILVSQALETDALQGQVATRVAASTKNLIQAAGVNPAPLLQQFSPDSQQTIMAYFS